MSTLTFSCPKCDKLHERIKPEMVGHKVRCQCGYVFRLGSKSDKQEWVVAELERKRELKKRRGTEVPPSSARNPQPDPAPPKDWLAAISITANDSDDAIPVAPMVDDSDDDVPDALPVPSNPRAGSRSRNQPMTAIPISDPPAMQTGPASIEEFPKSDRQKQKRDIFAAARASQRLTVAKPPSISRVHGSASSRSRKSGQSLDSPVGPVWSLLLTIIGVPGLIVVMIIFAGIALNAFRMSSQVGQFGLPAGAMGPAGDLSSSAVAGNLTIQIVLSLGMFVMYGALALAMVVTAIVAIMELTGSVRIKWASKVSGIGASFVLFCLLILFCYTVFGLFQTVNKLEAANVTFDKTVLGTAVFWLAFKYCLFAIVPMAVMITGFARVMKR